MRISNRTRWSTDDLRAIITAACKARGVPTIGLRVVVAVGRKLRVDGRATLGRFESIGSATAFRYGRWMKLVIANPDRLQKFVEAQPHDRPDASFWLDLMRTVDHEVAHLQGLKHKNMGEALLWCRQDVPWAEGLPLPVARPDPIAEPTAARMDRIEHARAKLKLAKTRMKRAITLVKKWDRRVRALERTS